MIVVAVNLTLFTQQDLENISLLWCRKSYHNLESVLLGVEPTTRRLMEKFTGN